MSAPGEDATDGARTTRRPISLFAAAGWTIAASIGVDLAVTVTNEARPGAAGDLVSVTACHLVAYLGVLFAMLRLYEPEGSLREVFGLRGTAPWAYLLAVPIGAGCYPTLSLLDELVARRFPLPQEETEIVAKLTDTHDLAHRLALLVAFVVVIPISEEIFFRGMLFGALKVGRTVVGAVLLTTALSLLAHEDLRTIGSTATLALLFTWLRARSGSSIPSCLAHAAFFAVPVARLLVHPDVDDVYSRPWTLAGAGAAIAAALVVQLTLGKERRALAGRLADG